LTRHQFVFSLLRPVFNLVYRILYNVHTHKFRPEAGQRGPYLVLSNHVTNPDPFFICGCLTFPVSFVASDHIFRLGFLSRAMTWLVDPIPKLKAASDIKTIRDMMARLKRGASVGLFPEGNRSWNGRIGYISPAIGKLVALMKVPVLLFRIDGGYLSAPRWGLKMRRGRIDCAVSRVLTPEQIAAMTVDEINALIIRELDVDDYAGGGPRVRYKGKMLAQSLETVLYACPKCGALCSITSKGDGAVCSACGLRVTYDEFGRIGGAPFTTVYDWDTWQRGHLADVLKSPEDTPVFSDRAQTLINVLRAKANSLVGEGTFKLFRDRFEFEGRQTLRFMLRDVTRITAIGRLELQFACADGALYEVHTKHERSAYKYVQAYELIRSTH